MSPALGLGGGEQGSPARPPEGAALSLGAPRRPGVWPGLGIFVLFKCQRLLLTPFPNMFLIYPVSLLREKLKEKKKKGMQNFSSRVGQRDVTPTAVLLQKPRDWGRAASKDSRTRVPG